MIFEIIGLIMFLSNKKKPKPKPQTTKANYMLSYANYAKTTPSNNNPGNIIYNNPKYYKGGLSQLRNGTVVFDTLQNGVRALIQTLLWYNNVLLPGLKRKFTIKNIVKSWAPSDDGSGNPLLLGNDEGVYSNTLEKLSGIDKNTVLQFTKANIYGIARAMCVQEHGLDAVTETVFNNAWNDIIKQ